MRRPLGLACVVALGACGGDPKPTADPILGEWESIGVQFDRGPPPAERPFSYDDARPTTWTRWTFRDDGLFNLRTEGGGAVTSVVGTWRRVEKEGAVTYNSPTYRLRLSLVNGADVSPEVRVATVLVYVTSRKSEAEMGPPGPDRRTHRLFAPIGLDSATGRLRDSSSFFSHAP